MSAPFYPYRLVVFGDGSKVRIIRFASIPERDKEAKKLVAAKAQVLVCTVDDVLNGGDEGRSQRKR